MSEWREGRKSCKEMGHTDDQLCYRLDERQLRENKAITLCNHSDVAEPLISHPQVIYSKKKQTALNPPRCHTCNLLFVYDFLSLRCQFISSALYFTLDALRLERRREKAQECAAFIPAHLQFYALTLLCFFKGFNFICVSKKKENK